MMYRRVLPAVAGVMMVVLAFLGRPAPVHADADTDAAARQLVADVRLFRALHSLHLTQAQLREIVQRLSNYFHAREELESHQADAIRPALPALKRYRAALETGAEPADEDQQQVNQALAGLKVEEKRVEDLRGETIAAIRKILEPTQLALVRHAAGVPDSPAPVGAPGVPVAPRPLVLELPEVERFGDPNDAPAPAPAPPVATAPPAAFLGAPDRLNSFRGLEDARTATAGFALATAGSLRPIQDATAPPAAVPQDQPAAGGQDQELAGRLDQLEQRFARLEQMIQRQMEQRVFVAPPAGPKGGYGNILGGPGQPGGLAGGAAGMPGTGGGVFPWKNSRAYPNGLFSVQSGTSLDDQAIAEIFLKPETLSYLRRRAAQ